MAILTLEPLPPAGDEVLKDFADVHFPEADRIVLVQDNLSTHTPASL